MKRAWYEFWNKKALDLAHENTKRSYMEGLIKKAWSYEGGRQIALCKFGKEICKAQKLENDPFSCYEQAAEQKQNEIQKLETEKTEKEQELCSRIYKGTISMNDKVSLRKHIKLITVDAEKAEKDYSKILTNWTAHAYKVERRGVEKKKPGRKRKAEIQEIKYLTAKELRSKKSKVDNQSAGNQDKSMESNDMFVEDPAEITSDNHDEGMESNDVMFVDDPAEITSDNHDEGMESNDVMFVDDPAEITKDNHDEGMESNDVMFVDDPAEITKDNHDEGMESNDVMFVDDPAEITSDNHDEGMESNDVMFVDDPAEITKDNHDEGMESNDVMFVDDPAEITKDNHDEGMESNDVMFVDDPAEITKDNHDEGMESNDVMFVEDPAEITKDNHDEGMESNDVMFVEDPAEITRDNNNEGMEKKNQEKQKKNPMTKKNMTLFIPQTYDTYLGIKLLFPGISQNTVGLPHGLSRGSNACTGFCLKLAEHFFNEKSSLHIKPALSEYRSSLHEIVSRYEDRNIQMMDTKSAMTYFGYQNSMKIISDTILAPTTWCRCI
ncbi:protein argonaute-2-like isoform X1 [Mytilus californianus]|uniref:protein argonaute-2-like isoform X1 n=1 Tax=Mytilus californianus TaxID=6549 RepID=UPI002248147B|nr:protein argonaute-2-like isoform X1 [Mytilus californianus]